jgi:predicted TIM-barrel fold metal-dependent hydrolase
MCFSRLVWCLCLGSIFVSACVRRTTEPSTTREPAPRERPAPQEPVTREAPTPDRKPAPLPGVWGGDRVIDIHAHIGSFAGFDLSLSNLLENQKRFGVEIALISNIDGANLPGTTANLDEKKANQATVEAVRKHPDRLRGIAWSRPGDGSPTFLEPFLQMKIRKGGTRPIFVAIKFHPNMNQFAADSAKAEAYMKLCQKYRLAAVFHCGGRGENADPVKIYRLAQKFPTVPVVLYHMGFGGEHNTSLDIVKEARTKKFANLYLGTAQARTDAVLKAIKTLGSQAVMFGTDATYYGKKHYEQYESMVKALRKALTPKEFQDVMRDNARKVFRLP